MTQAAKLARQLAAVRSEPGVYLMKDDGGKIIYIGKAANLKNRLASYFTRSGEKAIHADTPAKNRRLLERIASFDTILAGSEKEALILEYSLIKRHKPRYNVSLKDDKRYPSLRLDVNSDYPNLTIVRKPGRDNALYFGPYASAQAVRETLRIIHKTFKLRKCTHRALKPRPRPCLNYQMGTCLAPCFETVEPEVYREAVKEVVLFLKGQTPDLIQRIEKQMADAAAETDFERAAALRDKLFSLKRTLEKQVAVTTDFHDRDVIALARSPEASAIAVFSIRNGYLQGSRSYDFAESLATDSEMVGTFVRQYYEYASYMPPEICVSVDLDDRSLLEDWLGQLAGRSVKLLYPKRGEKRRLVRLATVNAEKQLSEHLASEAAQENRMRRLKERLKIIRMPRRIECFDNSSLGGTEPVSGMVVFENGSAKKDAYRRYKIRNVATPDDYAYMAEVLTRRYGPDRDVPDFPDLLMVDGGKGQLNVACAVANDLGLTGRFDIIGIAKADEKKGETEDKIYVPGRSNPVVFGRAGDLLLFLQSIRDEAHRFAITFQRKRRSVSALRSALDDIPGIGNRRKAVLLQHFGGIKQIRAARIADLAALPGISDALAETIKRHLSR